LYEYGTPEKDLRFCLRAGWGCHGRPKSIRNNLFVPRRFGLLDQGCEEIAAVFATPDSIALEQRFGHSGGGIQSGERTPPGVIGNHFDLFSGLEGAKSKVSKAADQLITETI
jgi:hypothetical protein